jgi:predicted AAA+ superfamily ATPase
MADQSEWLPRGIEAPLLDALQESPVVCLLGPRQCGKSALVQRL